MMIELECPYCKEYHEIPKDCEYGGEFTTPCENVVEVEYDELCDEQYDDVWPLYRLRKPLIMVQVKSTPHGKNGQPFYNAYKTGLDELLKKWSIE